MTYNEYLAKVRKKKAELKEKWQRTGSPSKMSKAVQMIREKATGKNTEGPF